MIYAGPSSMGLVTEIEPSASKTSAGTVVYAGFGHLYIEP